MKDKTRYLKALGYSMFFVFLIIFGLYMFGSKLIVNLFSHQVFLMLEKQDQRIYIAVILFTVTLFVSYLAKSLLNAYLVYRLKQKENKSSEILCAHQIYQREKQKIKDAMFKDYMKHQRK